MRKSVIFAFAALFTTASADAHQFGPGYWNAGGYASFCLHSDGTATSDIAGWSGLWSKQTYQGMETGTVVGNSGSGEYNFSLVIKGGQFIWNEWNDDLTYSDFAGNLQWTWLGHNCKGRELAKRRGPLLAH